MAERRDSRSGGQRGDRQGGRRRVQPEERAERVAENRRLRARQRLELVPERREPPVEVARFSQAFRRRAVPVAKGREQVECSVAGDEPEGALLVGRIDRGHHSRYCINR